MTGNLYRCWMWYQCVGAESGAFAYKAEDVPNILPRAITHSPSVFVSMPSWLIYISVQNFCELFGF